MEWISVEDRLPEEAEGVILNTATNNLKPVMFGSLYISFSGEIRWSIVTNRGWQYAEPGIVTHWQPLPDPPVKE